MMDLRRCERLPAKLEIELRSGGRRVQCASRDVSRHGLFILLETPPSERQLLAMRIWLPDFPTPMDVVGSVAHRVTTDDAIRTGAPAGMGIGFFALSGEAKARWDNYIDSLVTSAGGKVEAPVVKPSNRPTFLLRLRDLNRLQEFRERELRLGSMFLTTPVLRAVGDVVQLVIIHPITDQEFGLTASVTATSQGSPTEPKGMSLKISPLDRSRDVAFDAFVAGEEPGPELPEEAAAVEPAMQLVDRFLPVEPATLSPPPEPKPVPPPLPPAVSTPAAEPPPLPRPVSVSATPPPVSELATAAAQPPPPAAQPPSPQVAPALPPPTQPGVDPNAELRRAVDRDPDALGPRLRLGAALAKSSATAAEAIALLSSILEREPQHPLAHGSIALAHAQLGESSEAERHLTRALRLGHVDPELERRVRGTAAPA
jgi:hypothetical protein